MHNALYFFQLEEEIEKMVKLEGMKRKSHVLELARLMVRSEGSKQRRSLLKVIQVNKNVDAYIHCIGDMLWKFFHCISL